MRLEDIRQLFPELSIKVYGKPLVYLDNAATSQRPSSVISKWAEVSFQYNANLHRAVHFLANRATEEYESARKYVAGFIGASSEKEIVFTSGTTHSINLVAFSFGEAFVKAGDAVIVTEAEHHSDIVPWQMLCERKNASLRVVPVDDEGCLQIDKLRSMLDEKVRIVCVTHASNVLGIINPVKDIVKLCHERDIPVLVDGAQGIVHTSVDVSDLDCDFYAFSGHKIYAAPGTGVLYAKAKWLEAMPPYMGGGEMIESVSWGHTTFAAPPHKFEAGTQNISGVPTLVPALEAASMMAEGDFRDNAESVKEYVYDWLLSRSDIRLFGTPKVRDEKFPLFSFAVDGAHHEDLALIMDKMGIAVRSGQMCAEPLMDRFGVTGMLRASFAPYNTMQEAEYFVKSLDRAINMLR